jgi:hypothetical protein
MSWKRFAGALVEPSQVVEEQFRETACTQPRESALVSLAPEGEASITVEPVPPK